MINQEKVRIMTKCACYEKHNSKKELQLAGYFKKDYVKLQLLKTIFSVIIAAALLSGIVILAYYEQLFKLINQFELKNISIMVITAFLVLLVVYYIISRMIYVRQFDRAKKGIRRYYRDLKKLQSLYNNEQDKSPKVFEEGGVVEQNDEFIDY